MGADVGIRTRGNLDGKDIALMQRTLEYHRYAEECRKLANVLVNPHHKQKLQEMAAAWDMLAIERKQMLGEKKPD
jgi:hypothetical protein